MMLASTLDSAHAASPVRLRAYTSMKGVVMTANRTLPFGKVRIGHHSEPKESRC
jgi:hypothetical protein